MNIANIFTGIAFTLILGCQSPVPPKPIPAPANDIAILRNFDYSDLSIQTEAFLVPFYLDYDKQGNCVVRLQYKDNLKFAWDVRVVSCDIEFESNAVPKNTTSF